MTIHLKKPRGGNYVAALKEAVAKVPAGSVVTVRVEHDRWCEYLAGDDRDCNCKPNVEVRVLESVEQGAIPPEHRKGQKP